MNRTLPYRSDLNIFKNKKHGNTNSSHVSKGSNVNVKSDVPRKVSESGSFLITILEKQNYLSEKIL